MRTHRITAAFALAGVSLLAAACGSSNVSQAKFRDELYANLKPKGFTRTQVVCMTDKVYKRFSQSEIDQLYKAQQENQVPKSVRQGFDDITRSCAPG
ncbi:MAG: hypothetical protein HYX34_08160 [Actinobacteria bacterium]|nr:hypothetical protein [Actinomycetota bacterium]